MTTATARIFEVRRVDNVTTKASTLVGSVKASDHEEARKMACDLDIIKTGQTFRVIESPTDTEFEGWVIDRDYFTTDDTGRVGYGQRDVEAFVTEASFETVIGRTIEMRSDLKASLVKDPVRWRLTQDDERVYGGIVSLDWLLGEDDHAYNIWRFCETDVGGGELEFRAEDLPESFVTRHRECGCVVDGWVTTYG